MASKATAACLLLLGLLVGAQARSLQADVAVGGAATGYGAAGAAANVQGGQASTSTTATTQLTVDPWELGKTYPNLNAKVGQTITWKWTNGPHGVFRIPSNTCPTTFDDTLTGQEEVAAPAVTGNPTFTFRTPGNYWFACPVNGHCAAGMKFRVTVS